MLQRSFKPAKCKTSLKMAVSRMKLLKNKRDAQVKHLKREMAQLLESGQDQTAMIRVEHVLREEKTMAAYELVDIYCELIAARLPIIESQKNCPIDLKEAIASVIFASPRCADIPELMDVRKNLTAKYGKEFVNAALELRPDCGVSRMLVEKLSAKAPDGPTKIKNLRSIAEEHNVKWEPKSVEESELKPPEDLLNGPNSFEKSSNYYVDPPNGRPSSSHDEKKTQLQTYGEQGQPRGQVTHQPMEKSNMPENFYNHSTRTSSSSPNLDHSNVRDDKHGSSEAHLPGNGAGRMQQAHTYSLDGSSSPSRKNWPMEFKDARAAAQAAAESAERASMAARAAAELSSRSSTTMQYSAESREPSTYVKKNHSSSTLPNQPVAGGSAEHLRRENITRQYSAESPKFSTDIQRDEPQNYASSTMHSHVTGKSENPSYNQRNSGMSHGQIDNYDQDYHSDEDENLFSVEYKSSSLPDVKPVPASFAGGSAENLRHENITRQYSAESPKFSTDIRRDEPQNYASSTMHSHVTGKSENPSYNQRNYGMSHGQIDNYEQDYHSDEDENLSSVEYKSSSLPEVKPVPASFTDRLSLGNLPTGDAYSLQHISETRGDPGHASTGRKEPEKFEIPFTREPPDIRNVDYHEFDDQERSSHDVSYSRTRTHSYTDDHNIFANVSQHPGRSYDEDAFVVGDRENIQRYTDETKSYGNASTVFDYYSSDNDENIIDWENHHREQVYGHMDFPSSSETLYTSPVRDVNSQTRQDMESTRASTRESNVLREQKNDHVLSRSWTSSVHDSQADELPVTFDDSDGHGSESEEESVRSKLMTVDDASHEVKADFLSAEPAKIRQDASSSESGSELSFGTLTGGLRNKGYRLPPYSKVPADRRPAEEKSTQMEHVVEPSVSAGSQSKKEIQGTEYNISSSDDDSEDELQKYTSTGIKENNKAGMEPPVPFSEEPSGHRTRPNVGLSRRTKPSPSFPLQTKANTTNVEALGKRQIEGNRTEARASLQEPVVSGRPTFKPASESKRSSVDETFRSSGRKPSSSKLGSDERSSTLPKVSEQRTDEQVLETRDAGFRASGSSTKMVSSTGDKSSEGSSRDQPSHVHPKLPDYDTFAARLQSLRQNRQ